MTKDKLFAGLFPVPYEHSKWLRDQGVLIERLKKTKDTYLKEQAKLLEGFQKDNICSVLMMDIMADRVERHEKSQKTNKNTSLTTEENGDSINI